MTAEYVTRQRSVPLGEPNFSLPQKVIFLHIYVRTKGIAALLPLFFDALQLMSFVIVSKTLWFGAFIAKTFQQSRVGRRGRRSGIISKIT